MRSMTHRRARLSPMVATDTGQALQPGTPTYAAACG